MEVHEFCQEHKITYYVLPAHASHIVQPLDLVFYGSLKVEWKKAVREFKAIARVPSISKTTFTRVFRDAWLQAYTPEKIKHAFEASGLSPWNPERPDYAKCQASQIYGKMLRPKDTLVVTSPSDPALDTVTSQETMKSNSQEENIVETESAPPTLPMPMEEPVPEDIFQDLVILEQQAFREELDPGMGVGGEKMAPQPALSAASQHAISVPPPSSSTPPSTTNHSRMSDEEPPSTSTSTPTDHLALPPLPSPELEPPSTPTDHLTTFTALPPLPSSPTDHARSSDEELVNATDHLQSPKPSLPPMPSSSKESPRCSDTQLGSSTSVLGDDVDIGFKVDQLIDHVISCGWSLADMYALRRRQWKNMEPAPNESNIKKYLEIYNSIVPRASFDNLPVPKNWFDKAGKAPRVQAPKYVSGQSFQKFHQEKAEEAEKKKAAIEKRKNERAKKKEERDKAKEAEKERKKNEREAKKKARLEEKKRAKVGKKGRKNKGKTEMDISASDSEDSEKVVYMDGSSGDEYLEEMRRERMDVDESVCFACGDERFGWMDRM